MFDEVSILKMSKRELFNEVKSLDEALKDLRAYDPADREDEEQTVGAYFSVLRDYNRHYELLFRRMFRKHKIFKVNPEW